MGAQVVRVSSSVAVSVLDFLVKRRVLLLLPLVLVRVASVAAVAAAVGEVEHFAGTGAGYMFLGSSDSGP